MVTVLNTSPSQTIIITDTRMIRRQTGQPITISVSLVMHLPSSYMLWTQLEYALAPAYPHAPVNLRHNYNKNYPNEVLARSPCKLCIGSSSVRQRFQKSLKGSLHMSLQVPVRMSYTIIQIFLNPYATSQSCPRPSHTSSSTTEYTVPHPHRCTKRTETRLLHIM